MGCDRLEISPEDGASSLRLGLLADGAPPDDSKTGRIPKRINHLLLADLRFTYCHKLLPAALLPLLKMRTLDAQRRVGSVPGVDVGVVVEAAEDLRLHVVDQGVKSSGAQVLPTPPGKSESPRKG